MMSTKHPSSSTYRLIASLALLFSLSFKFQLISPQLQVGTFDLANQFRYDFSPASEDSSRPLNISELLVSKFPYLFKNVSIRVQSETANDAQQQSTLENRRIDNQAKSNEVIPQRNYFRILDKVFSRVTLPEVYKSSRSKSGAHCGLHIGCIEELPNFPALLKKTNITSTFTLYSSDRPAKAGFKIHYEPLVHYQMQDVDTSETEMEEKLRSIQRASLIASQAAILKSSRRNQVASRLIVSPKQQRQQFLQQQQQLQALATQQRLTASSWRSATKILHSQEYPFDLAALEQCGFNSSLNTRIIIGGYFAKEDEEWIDEVVRQWLLLEPQSNVIKLSWADANRGLYFSAIHNSRIVGRQASLFLHYLEQLFGLDYDKVSLLGHSIGSHIAGQIGRELNGRVARITGIDPASPVYVELEPKFRLSKSDAKFVDVIHTNGGSIARGALGLAIPSGHVDYYPNGGSIQPGCYFSSITKTIMDPVERIACNHRRSYRYYIEVIRITIRAAHIIQSMGGHPTIGTNLSSAHESYDELVGEDGADNRSNKVMVARRQTDSSDDNFERSLPVAFLFEAKQDDLVSLVQPEIALMRRDLSVASDDQVPLRRHIEFHLMRPNFPPGKQGTYFFKTRSESPFFATKHYALTLRTDSVIRRKISLTVKLNQTVVAEVELDEIPGSYALIFVPNDLKSGGIASIDFNSPPPIQLMWKYRSFSLLLNQQNELHLTSLELSSLEPDAQLEQQQQSNFIVKYSTVQAQADPPPINSISALIGQPTSPLASSSTSAFSSSSTSSASSTTLLKGCLLSGHMALTRNQWHRFEGRLVKA